MHNTKSDPLLDPITPLSGLVSERRTFGARGLRPPARSILDGGHGRFERVSVAELDDHGAENI